LGFRKEFKAIGFFGIDECIEMAKYNEMLGGP